MKERLDLFEKTTKSLLQGLRDRRSVIYEQDGTINTQKQEIYELNKKIDEQKQKTAEHDIKIAEQQATIEELADESGAYQQESDSVTTQLCHKVDEVVALKHTITKKCDEIKKMKQVGAQGLVIVEQEEVIDLSHGLLLEQRRVADAARENVQELLEDLKIKNREVEGLQEQLSTQKGDSPTLRAAGEPAMPKELQLPDTLPYTEAQFLVDQHTEVLSETQSETQESVAGMAKIDASKPSQDGEESVANQARLTKTLDSLHGLLDMKDSLIEALEDRLQNTKYIISCKNHIISNWECALGTCYAQLERIQESGEVETQVFQLHTSLMFDDELLGQATTIQTVISDAEVLEGLQMQAMTEIHEYTEQLVGKIGELEATNTDLIKLLGEQDVATSEWSAQVEELKSELRMLVDANEGSDFMPSAVTNYLKWKHFRDNKESEDD